MSERTMNGYPILAPEEAASFIHDGDLVGFSGFSAAASPKLVPEAIAQRADQAREKNRSFRIRVVSGANGGPTVDDVLADHDAISWRCPYQSCKAVRDKINKGDIEYVDMHLSQVGQAIAAGFFGPLDCAVVEASEVTADGRVYLTTSLGITPTILACARRIIIEINARQHPRLREMTDVYLVPGIDRKPLGINRTMDRIGTDHARIDPARVAGVVLTDDHDHTVSFTSPDSVSERIAEHVVEFLLAERRAGKLPASLPPLQAGVGNIGNAVMAGFAGNPDFPRFEMYTEVLQDSLVDLLLADRITGISAASLAVTPAMQQKIFEAMDFFVPRLVLRPQEISNNPEVIRRLGVISMNTAIEVDLYGNANSTHFGGTKVMNGIGGSGDFTSNGRLTIFMAPSMRKNGMISSIVPMCPHVDHNEHSIHVVVTDQGVADLRGLSPEARAMAVIENCAHPMYRDYLRHYVRSSGVSHIPHDLSRCFELHANLKTRGSMLPGGQDGAPDGGGQGPEPAAAASGAGV